MTIEQAAKRIAQLELQLHLADYGMGMPRDYSRVLELRAALEQARKDAAAAELDEDASHIDSDFNEQMGGY